MFQESRIKNEGPRLRTFFHFEWQYPVTVGRSNPGSVIIWINGYLLKK